MFMNLEKKDSIDQRDTVEQLVKKIDGINLEASLQLEQEKNAYWLKLEDKEYGYGTVEGKLYQPENDNHEIIIFGLGAPGDSVKLFEERFVSDLTGQNYSVFVMRHNGANVDSITDSGNQFINCLERQNKLSKRKILGDKDVYSLEEWTKEPAVAMTAFKKYKKVHYVSHSFGGLAFGISVKQILKEHPELIEQINFGNWISISGEIGRSLNGEIDKHRDFNYKDPEMVDVYLLEFKDKYNIDENWVKKTLEDSVTLRNQIYEDGKWFPEKIKAIHVNSNFDPFISPSSGREIQEVTNGLLVNDYSIGVSLDKEIVNQTILDYTDLSEVERKNLVEKIMSHKSTTTLEKIEQTIYKNFPEKSDELIRRARENINLNIGDAHEFPQMTPETLLKFIRMKVSGKHEQNVTSPFSKNELSRKK